MHPKEDTGGNQKESQTHRKADVRKTQCSKGAQVGDDGPVKMRGNADDAGKEEEEKSETVAQYLFFISGSPIFSISSQERITRRAI